MNLGIQEIGAGEEAEAAFEAELKKTDLVMDAIFGFSFQGEPRPPFDVVIDALKKTEKPILSVDIPSAWNVEKGDPEGKYFTPGKTLSNKISVFLYTETKGLSRCPYFADGSKGRSEGVQRSPLSWRALYSPVSL